METSLRTIQCVFMAKKEGGGGAVWWELASSSPSRVLHLFQILSVDVKRCGLAAESAGEGGARHGASPR